MYRLLHHFQVVVSPGLSLALQYQVDPARIQHAQMEVAVQCQIWMQRQMLELQANAFSLIQIVLLQLKEQSQGAFLCVDRSADDW
jgi:hypothetical protein